MLIAFTMDKYLITLAHTPAHMTANNKSEMNYVGIGRRMNLKHTIICLVKVIISTFMFLLLFAFTLSRCLCREEKRIIQIEVMLN